jgi:lipid II:glycine glycyltransferase (peptidoglycan interpeptide bridge formation enzyme)
MTRDEYVAKMKAQLEQWNAEVAKWEEKTKTAQAGMKAEYQKQLEVFRSRRDEGLYKLQQIQAASTEAWSDLMRGADEAWKQMNDAFKKARSHFEKN